MTVFIVSVATVIIVSAMCSLSEASIYAVRRPFIRTLTDTGSAAGPILESFKDNMERPIAAILIVNTAANTAGASVAGAQATALFGDGALIWFSLAFTLVVLLFSEIFPKVLGVVYNRPVARAAALPWRLAITALHPLVWLVEHASMWVKPAGQVFAAPEEEVKQLAQISADEGSISPDEAKMVRNVLALDDVTAHDVMTPRTVVFRLPATMTLAEVGDHVDGWHHSRMPIFDPEDADRWTGLVRAADVLAEMANGHLDKRLEELSRPLLFVPESTHGHLLLHRFIEEKTHLFAVVDEFGGMAGVVTLEDVFESLIGREIVDEVDQVADLREVAKRRGRQRGEES
ncbi:MAG: HlyC/CorC family transporter [Gemmatimonadetes bacterium]|nr:HlyC/CorC family transporter [Gemmatimonadota bacterium]